MLGGDYSPDGNFLWTGTEWVYTPFVVKKKLLKRGIYLLIGGILTTPIIVGFCIAPLGLLLMAFSVLQTRSTAQLIHSPEIAEAKGYVKHGFDDMGRQLYGPPYSRLYENKAQIMARKDRE